MTYSSVVAHQYTALLIFPNSSMPPMEADAAYLPSCELHSRSHLPVGHTGKVHRLRTCYAAISRLPDSENVQRNLKIAQILRLCGTYTQAWAQCLSSMHFLHVGLALACPNHSHPCTGFFTVTYSQHQLLQPHTFTVSDMASRRLINFLAP